MRAIITDTAALQGMTVADLAAYLRATGWEGMAEEGRPYTTWTRDGFELAVPLHAGLRDYPRRIMEVLHTISIAENRSQLDIFRDIHQTHVTQSE